MSKKKKIPLRHPIQPLAKDEHGTVRFKSNAIVRHLLDNNGKIDMNHLACQSFDKEDRRQFAQLIGYSLSGYGELSYVDDYTYTAAVRMGDGMSEKEAMIFTLKEEIKVLRDDLREPMARLFGVHPDDLKRNE